MKKIVFGTENIKFTGILNESQAASEIYDNLPVSSQVSCWGKEIYFDLGFKVSSESAVMELAVGDIGYWPQGKSLCVFFGPTPLSEEEDKPVPASPVVVVGKIDTDLNRLDKIKLGDLIRVDKA
ncbi:MAG: cyclophilin-like fold protein [Candidatus Omnitrophota bacterium]